MHGHEHLERLAAVVLVVSGGVFVTASLWANLRKRGPIRKVSDKALGFHPASTEWLARAVVAAMAMGAGLIHVAVVPHHLHEYLPFGIAFALLAAIQVAMAGAFVLGRWRQMRAPALVVMAAVVVVWLVSRTLGLPVGPAPWQPEAVALADLSATAFELGIIAVLALGIPTRTRGTRRARAEISTLAIIPLVGVIGLTTLVAMASIVTTGHQLAH